MEIVRQLGRSPHTLRVLPYWCDEDQIMHLNYFQLHHLLYHEKLTNWLLFIFMSHNSALMICLTICVFRTLNLIIVDFMWQPLLCRRSCEQCIMFLPICSLPCAHIKCFLIGFGRLCLLTAKAHCTWYHPGPGTVIAIATIITKGSLIYKCFSNLGARQK